VYDGPLAVLVNRFSASASEIFAGAIQDYGRGIVIGQQTYGKGTVQNLYPLDRYAPGAEPRFGQLTLTVGKYYRVTGESTQHRGVVPDIIVPSPVDSHMVGESTRETALPWDQIRPTPFSRQGVLGDAIEIVATQHQERRADDPNFRHLMGNIEAIEERRAQKSVSLNIETRRAENEAVEAEQLARENERRAALGLEPLESLAEAEDEDAPDVLLQEAARMVVDLATLPGAVIAGRGAGSKE
jgi:carboxyl-terminal processing protease